MDFLEKNLEDIIFESNKESLKKRGLSISGKLIRQLRIGNYGIADLVSFDRNYKERDYIDGKYSPYLEITIYELKKDKIGISAFMQAIGYARGLQRYFIDKRNIEFTINIVLIGNSIDKSGSLCYTPDLFDAYENMYNISSVKFYEYNYKIDGIYFMSLDSFKIIEEGF